MTPVLTEDALRQLPAPIVAKLLSLIQRIRRVLWWRGFWSTLAALVGVLLAIMAIDAAFDLESVAVRCLVSLGGLAVVGWVAWKSLVRPMRRSIGLAQVARLVEIHHPEMHERISTAVELLGSREAAGLRGSEELLAEVVKSAVVDVGTVTPESEYPSIPMRWPRRLAAGALGVLALVLVLWPFQGGMLMARALLPFANIGSATAFDLRVLTGDAAVGEGEPITLLVAAKGRAAKRVELRRETAASADAPASAPATVERLIPSVSDQARPGETVFALTLPSVHESFRYAAASGRARSKAFFVEVQRRPDVTGLRVTYSFPPYTGLEPKVDDDSLGDITALSGTRVEVTARLSQPAVAATLVYDQTENAGPPVEVAVENGQSVARWAADLTPGMHYRWTLHPRGAGERLGKPASGILRALDDLPPAVVIDSPIDRELTLRPNEVVPIVYTAADDHGFSAVDLVVTLDGKGERLLSMPPPEKDPALTQTWRGTAPLDLAKLPLMGVHEVRVRLRVADTLPPTMDGPQTAFADDIVIRLNWGAESFAQQTVRAQEDELRRELEQVKNDLWSQRRQAEQQAHQLQRPEQMDSERLRELEQLTEGTAASAAQLQEIAQKAAHSAFAERADAIEQTARNQVREATESLQHIPQSDSPRDRSASAERARDQLEAAARQIDDVLNTFDQDRQQGRELGELASLARDQQVLADQAAGAEASDKADGADAADGADGADGANAQNADAAADAEAAAGTEAAAAANPLTDPSATPAQRQEAFERWQQQQDGVEHRAQAVAHKFEQKVPANRQSDLAELAARAEALAREAEALASRQDAVAAHAGAATPAAATPPAAAPPDSAPAPTPAPSQAAAQAAQQQADVAAEAGKLAESVSRVQEESRDTLRENGAAAAQAVAASQALAAAADSGREASSALAQEAGQSADAGDSEASAAPANADPAPSAPAAIGSPSPGQLAVAETATSLDAAAAALQEMARTLAAQAEGVAAASQALTAASSQTKQAAEAGHAARQAGEEAAQSAREAGNASPEQSAAAAAAQLQALAGSAAAPAQQAATNLALAATTAQAAMGLPAQALSQQNMGQHGSPKPGDPSPGQSGQTAENNQPSNQPGQEATDSAGLQTSKDYGLPPEFAKLGLTEDDWTRLRGLVSSGSDGASSDQVPAEYRDLVRGYFRALATGAAAPAPAPAK